MPWYYRVLLILNIAYCCVGLMTKKLPAWGMFAKVEATDFHLVDAQGLPIEINSYLPVGAYLTSKKAALPVVQFICEKNQTRAPLMFSESISGFKINLPIGKCDAKL